MTEYKAGNAYLYCEWLKFQTPEIAMVAGHFRPWEFYDLYDTDFVVSIEGYEADGKVNVVVEECSEAKDVGKIIKSVEPWKLELCSLPQLDEA